jgi:class 3 adenylate cyclase
VESDNAMQRVPELPGRTITLLFTDVEASTRLLRQLWRDGYIEALGTHRRLLQEAFSAQGAVEIEIQSERVHIAFSNASDAVEAVVEHEVRKYLSGTVDDVDVHADDVPRARRWFVEVSYGRLRLDVTPVARWFRMARRLRAYGLRDGLSFPEHRAFIADAVAAADPAVDLSSGPNRLQSARSTHLISSQRP